MVEAMRIATYARCSTKSQADAGTSLVDQESRFATWLEGAPHVRVRAYADSISGGKNMRAEVVQRMLNDLPDLKVEAVVIDVLDRWSRDTFAGIAMIERLRVLGVALWELETRDAPFDLSSDADRDHLIQRLRDAEAERRRIKARQTKRYQQQRQRGAATTNRPAFGLTLAGEQKGRRAVVADANAPIVREVDERVLRGESQRSVLRWLESFPGAWRSRRGLTLALLDDDNAYVKAGVRSPSMQAALRELKGSRRQAYGSNRLRQDDHALDPRSIAAAIESMPDFIGPRRPVLYRHDLAGLVACGLCVDAGVSAERAGMQGRHVVANLNPYNLVCEGRRRGRSIHKSYMVAVHLVLPGLLDKLEKLRDPAVADVVLRAWEKEPVEDRSAKLRLSLERELQRLDGDEAVIDARVAAAFTLLAKPSLAGEAERVIERAGSERAGLAAQRAATLQKLADLPAVQSRSLAGLNRGELQFSAEALFEGRAVQDGQWVAVDVREAFAKWVRLLGKPVYRREGRRVEWRFIDELRPQPAPDYR
jgi:DNA invertase Pin-like site-specific DNA recombinase